MSLNYTTPLDDEVFPLSFANHQLSEHVSMSQDYSLRLTDETKINTADSCAVPRDTAKCDFNLTSTQDETLFSLESAQESNYRYQALANVQDCRMAVSTRSAQSCDKLTDLYANAAQQNYRLWLSSF
ncbi:Icy1p [Saccharomyces eubayanus]|uniref:Icy1p n=1 Tax=Saccharomyces eubayanus TaxID=1080349 RepID=UPI0006C65995|nr:ICY1-like protein [Saccharomyces eubayanus]KOG97525.1 ICY1-like protein [Saccharomyces eubayanus]